VERAAAAQHREASAVERGAEQARWADRAATSASRGALGTGGQQRAIDIEVEASYLAWAEGDRAQASADRAVDATDRLAAEQDRIAAEQDREAAQADREQDSRDRAAAIADRDHPSHAEPTDP
jgi:hypothetical protein